MATIRDTSNRYDSMDARAALQRAHRDARRNPQTDAPAGTIRQADGSLKSESLVRREEAEAQRQQEYQDARDAIEVANTARDAKRAKVDRRDAPDGSTSNASPTEHAAALIDKARRFPGDRDAASAAMEAAAVAGLITRPSSCDFCRATDAHPFPMPGRDVLDELNQAWVCDACARSTSGRARG